MTTVDLVLGILMLVFLIWGMFKGLLWTLIRILSFAGVILIISSFGEDFRYKLGDMLRVSPAIATVITYLLIFLIMMIIARMVYGILKKVIKSLDLGCFNRIGGGVFALAAYFLLLAMIVILIDLSPVSFNGRGVRPQNYRLNIKSLTGRLEKEINSRSEQFSEVEIDRIWEAIDEANARYANAKDSESRDLAVRELYSTIQSSIEESEFSEVFEVLEKQREELLKFTGKEITLESLILESVVEPMADYIETEIMGFDLI
jgi:uncharacterized membrane protein required for colicin V production